MPIAVERDALSPHGCILLDRCPDQRSQLDGKSVACQLQYIQARFPGRLFEVRCRSSPKVDHFHCTVHDYAGRRVIIQDDSVGFDLDVDLGFPGALGLFCPVG